MLSNKSPSYQLYQITIAIFCLHYACTVPVEAAPIKYSWSGTFRSAASADPWNVNGKPYKVTAVIDSQSPDLFVESSRTDLAAFEVVQVSFDIDGLPATMVGFRGRPELLMADFSPPGDRMSLNLNVEFMGTIEALSPSITLPESTFAFANPVERPPVFGAALASHFTTASAPGSNYHLMTSAGSRALGEIPEPNSVFMSLYATMMLHGARRHRPN